MCRCIAVSLTIIAELSPPQLPSGTKPSGGSGELDADEHAASVPMMAASAAENSVTWRRLDTDSESPGLSWPNHQGYSGVTFAAQAYR
jgi:hypothetical protein